MAKTMREAIDEGVDKNKDFVDPATRFQIREDVMSAIKDYAAHEAMMYTSRTINVIKDPVMATYVNGAMIGMIERIFGSTDTSEVRREFEKRHK